MVPSLGGKLSEPYRTNLINYLTDVKQAGFSRVTVTFGPMYTNDPRNPALPSYASYDPSKFGENWSFIQDVRPLIKTYGPADSRIYILEEANPNPNSTAAVRTQTENYITQMYANYVSAYGKNDVSISIMGGVYWGNGAGFNGSVRALINAFTKSGKGQPNFYSVDFYPPNNVRVNTLRFLQNVDNLLRDDGLPQPLTISETYYNNPDVAAGIRNFLSSSNRQIEEVRSWPLEYGSKCVSAPYSVNAYLLLLNPAPPASGASGQITCTPATVNVAPQNIATVAIKSSWNGFPSAGSIASVCVTRDDQPSVLFTSQSGLRGSLTRRATWIAAPHTYTFTLHQSPGGRAVSQRCSDTLLASCTVVAQ